ncbi:SubName: Full=Uncharacterized protein {ECO:0000313/EMBL:CCA71798.1} [Serendipita indica DSM 11827]|nr:SubName: Full=Uncharacterized protein {ECO:0000313/EMBL:CCA71798.1} [Serendipita indica DSM 11827]
MDSRTASERTFSLSQLPIGFDNPHKAAQDGSRRTSSASTASSMPRTPSSIAWDRFDVFSPVAEPQAFEASEYGSETSSLLTISPDTPLKRDSLPTIIHDGPQRTGYAMRENPRRSQSITLSSMETQQNRLSRAATMHTVPGVRPWPMPPPSSSTDTTAPRLSPLQDQNEEDVDAGDRSHGTDSDSPGESGDSANHLQRRRHIRRPTREKKDLPRPLPPLPASNLAHSQSTAGRFMTTPFAVSAGEQEPPLGDARRRSRTLNSLSGIRSLPVPNAQTQSNPSSSKSIPNKSAGKLVPVILPLKLHTLELRSSPSEAAGVLTKTPNRPSNNCALARSFMAPPMPADAAAAIDWDLVDDALGIDDDIVS